MRKCWHAFAPAFVTAVVLVMGVPALRGAAPSITTRPLSRILIAGESAAFTVVATGDDLTYQWSHNGQPVAGESGDTLNLASAAVSDRGWYGVTVFNDEGTARSYFRVSVVPPQRTVVFWGETLYVGTAVPAAATDAICVESGGVHCVAVRSDGTVIAWGDRSNQVCDVPPGLANVVAVSCGSSHTLALKTDGTVVAWGSNTSGQTNVPSGLRDVIAVSAGSAHSLALRADGTVVAWGANSAGESAPPENLTKVVDVASGFYHSVALRADGTVVAWGDNTKGELNVPAGLSGVTAISSGGFHSAALLSNGTVSAWGDNSQGQCTVPIESTPSLLVAAGGGYTMAGQIDGNLLVWGTGSYALSNKPAGVVDVAAMSVRWAHCLAIVPTVMPSIITQPVGDSIAPGETVEFYVTAAGTPKFSYQWYRSGVALVNDEKITGATTARLVIAKAVSGDSGDYTVTISNSGGAVTSEKAVLVVAPPPTITHRPLSRIVGLGDSVTLSIEASGVQPLTYQWRHRGQLVEGATGPTISLSNVTRRDGGWFQVTVTGADGSKATSTCDLTVSAVPVRGRLTPRAWGQNGSKQAEVPLGLDDVVAISGGHANSLALTADGRVAAWGSSAYNVTSVPVGLTEVVAIATGDAYALALKADGRVVVWDDYGAYVDMTRVPPATLRNVVAIAPASLGVALTADGNVVGWSARHYLPPDRPAGLTGVAAIAANGSHGLALKYDGSIVEWGPGSSTPTTVRTDLTDVIAVAAGFDHSLALRADGTVVAWGNNAHGQSTVPTGLTEVVQIAAQSDGSLALRNDGTVVTWGDNRNNELAVPSDLQRVSVISAGGGHGLALVSPTAIVVTTQPVGQTVQAGSTVTLSVVASGTPPYSYQWRRDGRALPARNTALGYPDAASATLTLTNVQESDAGTYTVDVTNAAGTVTSEPAAIVVEAGTTVAPVIKGQVFAAAGIDGVPISLSVNAAGAMQLSYQWYEGASGNVDLPLPGETGPQFTRSAPDYAQRYWVRVSNAVGFTDSATMFVLPWASIDVGFEDKNCSGASFAGGHYFVTAWRQVAISVDGAHWFSSGTGPGGKIAYGNGVFVSDGAENELHWSTDGTHWLAANAHQQYATITRVIFDGSRFIAVGDEGGISTSSDGADWTVAYANWLGDFLDVAQGAGLRIAVGLGTTMKSLDGASWTSAPSNTGHSFQAIAYGDGTFAAVSASTVELSPAEIWTSPDAVEWTRRSVALPSGDPVPNGRATIAYGGGHFVVAVGQTLLLSADAVNWAAIPGFFARQGSEPSSMAFGGGRFLFAGEGGVVLRSSPIAGFPTITDLPAQRYVMPGESTTVTVAASGSHLRYQWYRGRAGNISDPIPGATSETLPLVSVTSDQEYWVRVSNENDSVDGAVKVQVATSPTVTVTTPDLEAVFDQSFTLAAEIAGSPVPAIQWYQGRVGDISIPIAGANTNALVRNAAEVPEQFWCRATNMAGVTDSPQFRVAPWRAISAGGIPPNIRSLAYGAGLFIALADDGTYHSRDGLNWTKASPDINDGGAARIGYGDGQFVATTTAPGVVLASYDGRYWGKQSLGGGTLYTGIATADSHVWLLGGWLKDVVFGSSRYVALGDGLLVSSNGVDWRLPQAYTNGSYISGAYGNGKFIALRQSDPDFATSDYGDNWHTYTAQNPPVSPTKIMFAGDRFFAGGPAGVSFSRDGLSWTPVSGLGTQIVSLAVANGAVLAWNNQTLWRRELDGVATTITAISPDREIEAGRTTSLSVSATGSGLAFQWYRGWSGDTSSPISGATQSSLDTPSAATTQRYWVRVSGPTGTVDSTTVLVAVAGPPRIVGEPFSADVLSSSELVELTVEAESPTPVMYQWYEGRRGETRFPVVGATRATAVIPTPTYQTSYWVRVSNRHGATDSLPAIIRPWSAVALSPRTFPYSTSGIAYGNGRWVVTGQKLDATNVGCVHVSTDQHTWTPVLDGIPMLGRVTFGAGKFVAVPLVPATQLWVSSDGLSWSEVNVGGTRPFLDVFFEGGHFIAVTDGAPIAVSEDGVTWSVVTPGDIRVLSVTYGNGRFLAGGEGGLFSSTDASTWTRVNLPRTVDVNAVCFGSGAFLVVASDSSVFASIDGVSWVELTVYTSDGWLMLADTNTLAFVNGRFIGGPANTASAAYCTGDARRWWRGIAGLAQIAPGGGAVVGVNRTTTVTVTGTGAKVSCVPGGAVYRALPAMPIPMLTSTPSDQTVHVGQKVTLAVSAASETDVAFQWRKDGVEIPGATHATLTLESVQAADAGSYVVVVSNVGGSVEAPAVVVEVAIPPTIKVQPLNQQPAIGDTVTIEVVAAGRPTPSFEWRKNGTIIAGVTGPRFSFVAGPNDSGVYSVIASNFAGTADSGAITLTVLPEGFRASHSPDQRAYVPGQTITLTSTLTYTGTLAGLEWHLLLPSGWSYVTGDSAGSTGIRASSTGLLEWAWTEVPPSPFAFTCTLAVPTSASGPHEIVSMALPKIGTVQHQMIVRPDPLVLDQTAFHSADLDRDGRFGLSELLRVIELYNVRCGTVRTGCYRVDMTNLDDGFAAEPQRSSTSRVVLTRCHHSDTNEDGALSLSELLRVIELYNHRSGTVRTGQYHLQVGSEDGFAPGP